MQDRHKLERLERERERERERESRARQHRKCEIKKVMQSSLTAIFRFL